MPRSKRVDHPGAWHHVMNRGGRHDDIFSNDEDCVLFLDCVGSTVRAGGLEVHAYSLMPNHFHMLVRSTIGELGKAMQRLAGRYTTLMNARHGWDGPVFRGRYRNQLVTDEAYLRHLVAYIHLNPVKGKLVKRADEECWTSHREHLGLDGGHPWLSREMVLQQFGSPKQLADFVQGIQGGRDAWPAEMDDSRGWLRIIEDPAAARARVRAAAGVETPLLPPDDVLAKAVRVTGSSLQELRQRRMGRGANPARRFAIWMLDRHTILRHADIAEMLDSSRGQVAKVLFHLRRERPRQLEAWLDQWDA